MVAKLERDKSLEEEERELEKIKVVKAKPDRATASSSRPRSNVTSTPMISSRASEYVPDDSASAAALTASNIEDAILALDVASKGAERLVGESKLERHPERRMKASFASYEEREMPRLKAENPSLKFTQLKQLLFKNWQKSPENPMNQESVSYNATKTQEKEMAANIIKSKTKILHEK